MGGVRWWGGGLRVRGVHVAVHGCLLLLCGGVRGGRVAWGHVHAGVCGLLGLRGLLLLGALFGKGFGLLLLLDTWGWGAGGGDFEVHLGLEGAGKLLLGDERVGAGLLWGPAFERVDVQEAVDEVDEGFAIGHFCNELVHALFSDYHKTYLAPSHSASCPSWASDNSL